MLHEARFQLSYEIILAFPYALKVQCPLVKKDWLPMVLIPTLSNTNVLGQVPDLKYKYFAACEWKSGESIFLQH